MAHARRGHVLLRHSQMRDGATNREISKHGANSHASTFTAAKSETGQHLAKLYNKLSCANANGQPF